ncbi:MAG: hypothetical protein IKH59_01440 [Bacteroidaceae bacterium]|nr:hypothetical protein [Bacteroidaceae bacterium]
MKHFRSKKRWLLILSAAFLLLSCANGSSGSAATGSKGKQAAREFIKIYNNGSAPEIKDALLKYGDTLHGQDLLDFYEELEKQGIYF